MFGTRCSQPRSSAVCRWTRRSKNRITCVRCSRTRGVSAVAYLASLSKKQITQRTTTLQSKLDLEHAFRKVKLRNIFNTSVAQNLSKIEDSRKFLDAGPELLNRQLAVQQQKEALHQHPVITRVPSRDLLKFITCCGRVHLRGGFT